MDGLARAMNAARTQLEDIKGLTDLGKYTRIFFTLYLESWNFGVCL